MIIELCASKDLRRWIDLDAPQLTRPGSPVLGAHPISSTEHVVSWQCHVIVPEEQENLAYFTVVAVQARSQYSLLVPYLTVPSPEQLAEDLIYRWGNEMMHRMVDASVIFKEDVETVAQQYKTTPREWYWYLNSDPQLQIRAEAAEEWITGYMDAFKLEHLEEDHVIDLGRHINSQSVREGGFEPNTKAIQGFVADGLYRFADGLCDTAYENTIAGAFPWPWGEAPVKLSQRNRESNNLVSLKDYRNL
ncbi:MAG: hypothetical protein OEU36_20895 [Gammaproteobacteria bacterium]|jgi:hypothetical protein|nr:hypothetical protein [Gammaproteobacteria bacterium]